MQEGFFMQRIPTHGGRISAEHLSKLAELADRYTAGTPLHLTTRQSIELHNVPDANCGKLLQELHATGLSTFGAGGDNVRAITVCPCCSTNPEAFDIEPLAAAVTEMMACNRPQYHLPRKFKISFHGCSRPESKPFLNDLAFGAVSETAVRVIGAGSMGPMPQPGIVLYEELAIAGGPGTVLKTWQSAKPAPGAIASYPPTDRR
ncbi:MAG: hypothetical protein LLF76_14670 [Planctomycetaceae bacterium]|nr:hypothetical protein [Planctomycetaceae bacterium]